MLRTIPRLALTTCGATAATAVLPATALAHGGGEPAGGAPIGDVIWGGTVGALLAACVLVVGIAHRRGRIRWVGALADFSGRVSGFPRWYALPAAIGGISLLIAVTGFYWDVATHIDNGRDPGAFGNAAHFPILIGLGGIALAGIVAVLLGSDKKDVAGVALQGGWLVPLGGLLVLVCGAFALSGFPLDDIWHRLFGQDVTLWGPTHVLMIAGASLATLGLWVLLAEATRAKPSGAGAARANGRDGGGERVSPAARRDTPVWVRLRRAATAGAFLVGLSTLQGEFDYGVPQFQMVFQPIMLMLAAGVGLVAARVYMGRGGAFTAVAFFLVLRGLITLLVGPILGLSTLHFPLYLAEAAMVELAAARLGTDRAVRLGLVSGVLIGTVGLAAEWGWSHVWMPLPWPSSLLPAAAPLGFATAVAAGTLGGYVGGALVTGARPAERPQLGPAWLAAAAGVVVLFCLGFPLPMNNGSPASATFALRDVKPPPDRQVAATVTVHPQNTAAHAEWMTVTAWQGGGLVVNRLRQVAPGRFVTTQPIPVYGKWKAMLRMEDGRGVRAVPIYLPADPAIPVKGVPAKAKFTRPFVRDKKVLQREAKSNVGFLAVPAYLVLLAIVALWLSSLTWGLRRLAASASADAPSPVRPSPPKPRRGLAVPRPGATS
jgi:hypothetical protein